MHTYMFQGCYTAAAIASMVQHPEDRTIAVRTTLKSCGGKLEGFWLAFGEYDFVGIATLPDPRAAAAFALAAVAGGGLHNFKTCELLPWTEGVKAFGRAKTVKYRAPAQHLKASQKKSIYDVK